MKIEKYILTALNHSLYDLRTRAFASAQLTASQRAGYQPQVPNRPHNDLPGPHHREGEVRTRAGPLGEVCRVDSHRDSNDMGNL